MSNTQDQAMYMDLKLDFTFKKIFKPQENRDILEAMVNTMLFPDGEDHLTIDHLDDPETQPQTKESRFAIVDLYCTTSNGERVYVEIQKTKHPNFANRIQINEAHMTLDQVPKGKLTDGSKYDFKLSRMYFLSICNFSLPEEQGNPDYHHHIVKMNKKRGTVFSKLVTEVYVELPKFTKKWHELETMLDRWVFLFKHLGNEHTPPEVEEDLLLRKVREMAYLANKSKNEMTAYERERMAEWVYHSSIQYAKSEGVEQERARANKLRQAERLTQAKAMKADGMPAEAIAKYTGLSIAEVQGLA